jgi:hypothetical protein
MTKNKAKNRSMGGLLGYLDQQINGYYKKTGNYPKKIIMSPGSKEKLFSELELEPTMDNSWKDKQDNYRGIKIEISNIEEIKLE